MDLRPMIPIHKARRYGGIRTSVTAALVTLLLLGGFSAYYLMREAPTLSDEPMVTTVSRGPYEVVAVEQGEVESSNNVEIRCEVKSRGSSGTAILEVIPEGTMVKEGDLLVRLDSSALESERDAQQIVVNTSYGNMVQAQNTLEAAQVAKEEYLQGAYKQEEQLILSEIFVAEENLKRSQLSVESGERLAAKGLVTSLQLDGDRFAVEKAKNELDSGKTKLMVLQQYTKRKMLIQFDSDIKTAEVKFENEKKNYEVELKKLQEVETQIAKCTIKAPSPGQVVYANIVSSRGGSAEFVVEAGAVVREQQVIIRLPDPTKMQVRAKVNESRITMIKPDMPVEVRIDAFGGEPLLGRVIKVNQYAEPSSWFGSQVKQYACFIELLQPPPGIRPGLTAEARIQIESRNDALQLPVQALYEHQGHMFCLVKQDGRWQTKEIEFDSTNDKMVALKSDNLNDGQQVALNPRRHQALLDLPELAPLPGVTTAQPVVRRSEPAANDPAAPAKAAKAANGAEADAAPQAAAVADATPKLETSPAATTSTGASE